MKRSIYLLIFLSIIGCNKTAYIDELDTPSETTPSETPVVKIVVPRSEGNIIDSDGNETAATKAEDHILVHVVNEGVGSGCPLYTDTVRVHYRGRLIPSPSYAEGLVFDQSWSGDYNLALMTPVKFGVAALTSGFSTAVMNMHIGDRWEVYIPYALGYGSAKSGSIPAYSALVFDITMMAYYHPGAPVPAWKANESFWEPGD